MEYLLFAAYLAFFSWLVTRIAFFRNAGFNKSQLIILFLLKVIAGIFYGWIGLYYGGLAQMADTWKFHSDGMQEYQLLQTNPAAYFNNFLDSPHAGGFEKLFSGWESYWNDLKNIFFIKIISIFNLLSFGHYYVNVIFYSFIALFGPMAIFRVMIDIFPNKRFHICIACFLVPSFLYWTSGVHKDGIVFVAISLIAYHSYFGWKDKKFGLNRLVGILSGLLLLLILRNFILVSILPALFAFFCANRFPQKRLVVFLGLYFIYIILFFTCRFISPKFDFPAVVVAKQQEFLMLQGGHSSIPIEKLKPTVFSFFKNSPEAISLSTLRPFPKDVRHLLSLTAAIEIILILLLLILLIFFRVPAQQTQNFIYFCVFFSFSMLLIIGFSVNNLGAIVRYRSFLIPLLLSPIIAQIDWKRLEGLIINNKNT